MEAFSKVSDQILCLTLSFVLQAQCSENCLHFEFQQKGVPSSDCAPNSTNANPQKQAAKCLLSYLYSFHHIWCGDLHLAGCSCGAEFVVRGRKKGLSEHSLSPSASPKICGAEPCPVPVFPSHLSSSESPVPHCFQHPERAHGLKPLLLLPKRGQDTSWPHGCVPRAPLGGSMSLTSTAQPGLPGHSSSSGPAGPAVKASIPAAFPRLLLAAALPTHGTEHTPLGAELAHPCTPPSPPGPAPGRMGKVMADPGQGTEQIPEGLGAEQSKGGITARLGVALSPSLPKQRGSARPGLAHSPAEGTGLSPGNRASPGWGQEAWRKRLHQHFP